MNTIKGHSKQSGVVLLVAMVGLVVLTTLGITALGDVGRQSVSVRNEEFRQQSFYAAGSEINMQISLVNGNTYLDDDQLILNLIRSSNDNLNLSLPLQSSGPNPLLTNPPTSTLLDASIDAKRSRHGLCDGESAGVNVLTGTIDVTAQITNGSIQSRQQQRFEYCWP